MKKLKKIFGILAGLALVTSLVTGCGSDSNDVPAPNNNSSLNEWIIIPNNGGNTASIRYIDVLTGNTRATSNVTCGNGPTQAKIHPNQRIAYIVNRTDGTITAFTFNPSNGTGTVVPGSPFAAPGVRSININPTGAFLYAIEAGGNQVQAFAIGNTGALTAVPGGTIALPAAPSNVAASLFTSNGAFFHVGLGTSIQTLNVNTANGLLTLGNNTAIANALQVNTLLLHPNGNLVLAVVDSVAANAGQVVPYSTNANGGLTALAGVNNLAFDPGTGSGTRGGLLYVGVNGGNLVYGYNVDPATGAQTALAGSPFAAAGGSTAIAFDPTNSLLFGVPALGTTSTLTSLRINNNGALAPASQSPFNDNMTNPFQPAFAQFAQ